MCEGFIRDSNGDCPSPAECTFSGNCHPTVCDVTACKLSPLTVLVVLQHYCHQTGGVGVCVLKRAPGAHIDRGRLERSTPCLVRRAVVWTELGVRVQHLHGQPVCVAVRVSIYSDHIISSRDCCSVVSLCLRRAKAVCRRVTHSPTVCVYRDNTPTPIMCMWPVEGTLRTFARHPRPTEDQHAPEEHAVPPAR